MGGTYLYLPVNPRLDETFKNLEARIGTDGPIEISPECAHLLELFPSREKLERKIAELAFSAVKKGVYKRKQDPYLSKLLDLEELSRSIGFIRLGDKIEELGEILFLSEESYALIDGGYQYIGIPLIEEEVREARESLSSYLFDYPKISHEDYDFLHSLVREDGSLIVSSEETIKRVYDRYVGLDIYPTNQEVLDFSSDLERNKFLFAFEFLEVWSFQYNLGLETSFDEEFVKGMKDTGIGLEVLDGALYVYDVF